MTTAIFENDSEEDKKARVLQGADIIWEVLVEKNVETIFGYPGGAIMPAYDSLSDYPSIHHVLVRHEQSAAHMADGFARASGGVGVCVATSGPGATNLVTGIATAMLDSIPLLCITGQVSSLMIGTDAFQETDVGGITLPITKYNYLVTRAEDIAPTLREAYELAKSGRPGPVLVDITKDAQQKTCEYRRPAKNAKPARVFEKPLHITSDEIDRAMQMLAVARRPLILAGHGIIMSESTELLVQVATKAGIPVASTLLGLGGFPASHPMHLGMLGMHGEAWVNNAVQTADLILGLGMRFDDRVTGDTKRFATQAKKIHVDIDASEFNKTITVELAIHGCVKDFLREVNSRIVSNGGASARAPWFKQLEETRADTLARDVLNLPGDDRLLAAHVMHDLWRFTEGKALLATDVGQHQMWAAQYYRHERPRSLLTSGGLGTMGFALPAGIGGCMACPNEEVWVIAGDGGFQMTAPELSTIKQEGLKLNIAVINNGYLGMVRQWQEMFFDKNYVATPLVSPDFVKLAEAHGHEGIRVHHRHEIEDAVRRARASKNTVLIEFVVQQEDTVYPMVKPGAAIHEMVRRPNGSNGSQS